MRNKIFVVRVEVPCEYEDYGNDLTWNVCAFHTVDQAKTFVEMLFGYTYSVDTGKGYKVYEYDPPEFLDPRPLANTAYVPFVFAIDEMSLESKKTLERIVAREGAR